MRAWKFYFFFVVKIFWLRYVINCVIVIVIWWYYDQLPHSFHKFLICFQNLTTFSTFSSIMTISTAQITSQNMPTAEIARKQNMQRNHPLIQQFINKFNEQSMRHASSNTKNLSCPICHNSGHHVSNCPKFDICYKFNLVWEKEKAYCSSCEKRHVCMICEKEDHTAGGCPDRKKYCSDYRAQ